MEDHSSLNPVITIERPIENGLDFNFGEMVQARCTFKVTAIEAGGLGPDNKPQYRVKLELVDTELKENPRKGFPKAGNDNHVYPKMTDGRPTEKLPQHSKLFSDGYRLPG